MTWTNILTTSIDAWLYGFFGALAGALVTWLLGRPVWKHVEGLIRERTAATNRLADAHEQQAQHLAAIAANLGRGAQ